MEHIHQTTDTIAGLINAVASLGTAWAAVIVAKARYQQIKLKAAQTKAATSEAVANFIAKEIVFCRQTKFGCWLMFFCSVSFIVTLMYSRDLDKVFVFSMSLLGPVSVGSFICAAWLGGYISAVKHVA